MKRVTQAIFHKRLVNKMHKTGEHIKQLTPYVRNQKKIKFKCLDCGLTFKESPQNIRSSKYICPNNKQKPSNISIKRNRFHKRLIKKAYKTGEYVKQLTSYINLNTPIKFKCLKCGLTFKETPNNILNKKKKYICPNNPKNQKKVYPLRERKIIFYKKLLNKEKYNGEHIKLLSPYIDSRLDIKFKCLDCGTIFSSEPGNIFVKSYICPKKQKLYKKEQHRKNRQKKFLRKFKAKKLNTGEHIKQLTPYTTNNTPVTLKCLDCGTIFQKFPDDVLKNEYICSNTRGQRHFKKIFIHKLKLNREHIKLLTHYKGFHKLIKFKCLDCGLVFKNTPKHIKGSKYICPQNKETPYFQGTQKSKQIQYHNLLIHKMHKTGEHIKQLTPFINTQSPVKLQCKDCGLIFKNDPEHLLKSLKQNHHSYICPNSYAKIFYKKLVNKMHKTGEHIKLLEDYKNGETPIKFKCKDCGLTFKELPDVAISAKYICPKRNKQCHKSKGEIYCSEWLNKHHLKCNQDYYYSYICKYHPYTKGHPHFDFYLPYLKINNHYNNGIVIEFDGGQHFHIVNWSGNEPIWQQYLDLGNNRYRDAAKDAYCAYKHIKLIRIKNNKNYTYKSLRLLVNQTLNQKLLPILKQNKQFFKEANNIKHKSGKRSNKHKKSRITHKKHQSRKHKKVTAKQGATEIMNNLISTQGILTKRTNKLFSENLKLYHENTLYQQKLDKQSKLIRQLKAKKHGWLWKAFHRNMLKRQDAPKQESLF